MFEVIVDGGESAMNLNRPGQQRLLTLVDSGKVKALIVAKLDRLTRSVKDLCGLLELFEKRIVAVILVAESLDTASSAGRLGITIMAAVPQWEREAIGEPTRSRATQAHQRGAGRGISGSDSVSARTASTSNPTPGEQGVLTEIRHYASAGMRCEGSLPL